ncbi:sugar ABC transporter permease [Paenibacillus sp. IB182496]|uniref:Sugar ABC transporter permease n=2 Tax=Paenibacillus sabuli TaxID=2772509 RepID=A0A927GQZ7_9BACL|nr:sugar ABC transporter permease [Paenibacillus sabuli]
MRRKLTRQYELYVFLLPTLLYFALFQYGPMYGIQIAFKNYQPVKGFLESPWVGWSHFIRFFRSYQFELVIKNTLVIGLYELLLFPIPVAMAILINQLTSSKFKRFVQTVTYAPHFISLVVVVGMLYIFLSPHTGLLNHVIVGFGGEPVFFLGSAEWFKPIFVLSSVWQNAGWGAIIYLAALAGIHPELHEAAVVDGATKLQRIRHVDIPGILPTVVIMLILNMGQFMNVGFEKAFLMQNSLNAVSSEVIQTYVYKSGLQSAQYSYSAAIGFFNSLVNFVLLVIVNAIARRTRQASLW